MLFEYSLKKIIEQYPDIEKITVNSSPYAEKIYAGLGFNKVMDMQEKDGIKFVPMEYRI
jgi:predicted GNAT family N-acyltransferase